MISYYILNHCGLGTNENVVYFWGTRYVSPYTRPSTREVFSQSFGSRMATPSDAPLSESDVHTMMHLESMRKGKKHVFKKYHQFILNSNTSCFLGRVV